MERVSLPHTPCDRLHKLQQHRSSWAGVSSSTGGQLSLRKSSFLVLVAAHMLGRSHHSHMKLAYHFPTVFRPLTWVPLNLTELVIHTDLFLWCCKGWVVTSLKYICFTEMETPERRAFHCKSFLIVTAGYKISVQGNRAIKSMLG